MKSSTNFFSALFYTLLLLGSCITWYIDKIYLEKYFIWYLVLVLCTVSMMILQLRDNRKLRCRDACHRLAEKIGNSSPSEDDIID
jgi:hypothetical protein